MEELLFFIFGMIAEAVGLKKKKPVVPPAPLSPAPPRRPMPASPPVPLSVQTMTPRSLTARPLPPRRPDAGGPAVNCEATTADFIAQEEALLLTPLPEGDVSAPRLLGLPVQSGTPTQRDAAPALFATADELVRAVILQEALGPPLCRRQPLR